MRKIWNVLLVLTTLAGASAAAEYPDKPIKFVIPFPAGQSTDILGRGLANEMSGVLKQPIIIENKGGAGGIIGIEAAKRAPNDGYTVLIGSSGPLSINENLHKDIPYNTLRDFEPVGMVLANPQFLVTRADFPANNLAELIALVKQKPGEYKYASGGVGLTNHLTMEMLKLRTGMDARHIPYRGASAALTGLIGGDTDMMFESGAPIVSYVESGKLKIIAVGGKSPSERFPDVPSVDKAGVPGFDASTWIAMMVPKGTPEAVIERLNAAIPVALQQPALKQLFASSGVLAKVASPEETRAFIQGELNMWKETIDKGNIKPE